MIARDKKLENDTQLAFFDYLASFWNSEGVKKAQELRNKKDEHVFKDDKDFEQDILSGNYKENQLLDAIINMRKNDPNFKNEPKEYSKVKIPADMSSIYNTLNKFNK